MKVLQINTFFYNGGSTGQIVNSLSEAMEEKRIENMIIYGVNNGEIHCKKALLIQPRIYKRINEFVARLFGNHGFNNWCSSLYAIWIIRKFNPDVVHIHNLHGTYINISVLFGYLKKKAIPIVMTMHDSWLYTGRCACYDYCNCYKWMDGCGKCNNKRQYPVAWLLDSSKKNLSIKKKGLSNVANMTLVTPSLWLKKEVEKSYLNKFDIKVINNGIDLDIFMPRGTEKKDKLRCKKMMLACAYNWTESKGIKYLKKIAESLDDEWILAVIGRGSESVLSKNKNVVFIPRIYDKNELAMWYSSADVFINPTLEDTFPTVNIESLACGTPCVTFNTGGAGEIVDDKTGVVVDKHDWQSMFQKAISVNKLEMSPFCVKRAKEYYSCDRANRDYIDLYKSIFSNNTI